MTRKLITSALAAIVACGSLTTVASAADWRGGHGARGSYHGETAHRGSYRSDYGHRSPGGRGWNRGYRGQHGYRRHRDHTGRYVAIGAFATILGLALAAESNGVRRDYYEDHD